MKSTILFSLLFLASIRLFGQQFTIEGKVVSSDGGKLLPFATLSLSQGTRGTISNARGQFRLVLAHEDRYDSLKVSYVGYNSSIIKLYSVNSQELVIELVEKEEKLEEVVVTSLTANAILEKAIDNISENYFEKPYTSKGFYRLTSKKNEKYVHLSEVAFDLYRSKDPEKEDLFRLDTWRGITDEREANGIDLGMKPSGVIDLDEVNSKGFIKTFNKKKFLREHNLILEGEYTYNEEDVYVISFDQKEGIKDVGFEGEFFIAKEDFAFLELNYGLDSKSLHYHKFSIAYRALMEIFDIDIKILSLKTRARYRKIGDKYYLQDVGYNTDYRFKSNRSYYNFILNTRVDYLVSEVNITNPEKFASEETLSHGKLIEFQNVEYDSLFWEDYTIVLPTSDFDKISNVILENNKANDTKKEVERRLKKFPKESGVRIDSILSFYHKRGLFHGNALIEFDGELILNKSYPYQEQRLDLDSRFRIGSTSKTFTSMLVLMMEKEHKLKLSDSISKYIPAYRHGNVTIEQLLSHQSGIPNYLSKAENLVDIYRTKYSIEELIQKFCSDSLEFTSGRSFQYSNSGYVLLAKIAEVVGGKPFGQLLSEKIFNPLGMKNTSLGINPDNKVPIEGYYYGQPEEVYPIENVIGAGGVISTAEDLLKWSRALESGLLVDRSFVEKAMMPRTEYKDWEAEYGYGWMIDKYLFKTSKKHKIVYHPGTDMAFYTMFLKQPDQQATIVLLSNTGDFPRFEISDLILEVLN